MPRRADIKSVAVIGSGPIVIGQACEFDYSGSQALRVLRAEGMRTVLINSNPATIMTDPDFADRTYLEPLDADVLAAIVERERPDAVLGTLGGQTAPAEIVGSVVGCARAERANEQLRRSHTLVEAAAFGWLVAHDGVLAGANFELHGSEMVDSDFDHGGHSFR